MHQGAGLRLGCRAGPRTVPDSTPPLFPLKRKVTIQVHTPLIGAGPGEESVRIASWDQNHAASCIRFRMLLQILAQEFYHSRSSRLIPMDATHDKSHIRTRAKNEGVEGLAVDGMTKNFLLGARLYNPGRDCGQGSDDTQLFGAHPGRIAGSEKTGSNQ